MDNRNKLFNVPFDPSYNLEYNNRAYNWVDPSQPNQSSFFQSISSHPANLILENHSQDQSQEAFFQQQGHQILYHNVNPQPTDASMLGEISFIKYEENEFYQKDYLDDSPILYQHFQNASDTMTRKGSEYTYFSNNTDMKAEFDSENPTRSRTGMEIESENASNDHCSQGVSEKSSTPQISSTFSEPKAKIEYEIKMEFEPENPSVAEADNELNLVKQVEAKMRKNFGVLRDMIDRVLRGDDIKKAELEELNDFEKTIVISVNQKKSKSEGVRTSKRREEKQKLFFKSALKHIENDFLITVLKCRSTLRKKESDVNSFYSAFFAEVAQEKGLDLSTFYPPCQRRKYRPEGVACMKNELKSFNLRYIELILSSKKFREETLDFLENEFSQSYAKSRLKKIDKLLENALNVLSQSFKQSLASRNASPSEILQQAIGKLQDLILNNPKSKLPWSNAELEETKHFARETIEKVSLNRRNH